MSTYTITRETILAARKERSKQVKAARGELLKALADTPNQWDARRIKREYRARLVPAYAHIELVNGTTIHAAVHITQLSEWARLTRGSLTMRVLDTPESYPPLKVMLETERQPGVRSAVTVYGRHQVPTTNSGRPDLAPFTALGHPIRLVAPADGGEFVLDQSLATP